MDEDTIFHAHSFLADQVLDGHFYVVEFDECRSRGALAAHSDASHRDAGRVEEGNNQHRKTPRSRPASANSHRSVMRPKSIRDPAPE